MKIAVCFSGQIRTGIENHPNIKEFFGKLYNDCDFFIHTWNFSEYKTYNGSNISKKPTIEPIENLSEIVSKNFKCILMNIIDFLFLN